ncbi:MAG TPA: pilus assembly protein TadG-related protein, partial [Methylocystis sp.]|nr:pilus assembly protein TadG-related protein [Methylocystis sp.]
MLKTTLKEKQRALASAAGEFQRSKGGAVMMTFGLAVIPVMLALGVGIDLSRLAAAKSTLQASSDAAVLMAGAQPTLTQAQRQTLATGAIAANLLSTATSSTSIANTKNIQNLTVTEMEPSAGVYQVKVTATVPTTIMKIAGFSTMSVRVYSQAQTTSVGSNHPLEMALALDNTGSMAPNISALITAA